MITDNQLYSLALFLGSAAMLLIILYHFLEVNKRDDDDSSASILDAKKKGSLAPAVPVVPVVLDEKSGRRVDG